jgi:hypothetical protein
LEGIPALLQELLILSRILSLLGLLAESTRTNLRLSPLQSRCLRSSSQPSDLLTRLHTTSQIGRNHALLPYRSLQARLVGLLIDWGQCLTHTKLLLPTESLTLETGTVATKCAALDSFGLLLRKLLSLLLLQCGLCGGQRGKHGGVLIVTNLLLRQRANITRARHCKASSGPKIRLSRLRSRASGCNARLLGRIQASNKFAAILLKRLFGNILGASIDGVISRQDFGRNRYRLCRCRGFTATTHLNYSAAVL